MTTTVKVRIAVAVDAEGQWNAAGWSGSLQDDLKEASMDTAVDGVNAGEARYWVTADLPIPEAVEVKGQVETGVDE